MSGVSLYERVLGEATDERLRGWAINAAIAGFLLHVWGIPPSVYVL